MTGARPSQFQAPPVDPDEPALPIPPAMLEEAFRLLVRAVRARLLYLPNNPNHARAAEQWSAIVAPWFTHAESCVIGVQEHAFTYGDRIVHREEGGESLPWQFFKDGVRELDFRPGFEGPEATRFLDVLVRARKASPDEDDLLTLLWMGDFRFLRYRFVDAGGDGVPALAYDEVPPPNRRLVDSWKDTPRAAEGSGADASAWGEDPPPWEAAGPPAARRGPHPSPPEEERFEDIPESAGIGGAALDGTGSSGPASGSVGGPEGAAGGAGTGGPPSALPRASGARFLNLAEYDSTLYFLDSSEIEYLQDEVRREYARDDRQNVTAMLLDIFELQTDPLVREEIATLLDGWVLQLLAAGQLGGVSYVLREVQAALPRARDLEPPHRARLGGLADRLSEPATLSQLLQGLDDAPDLPPQEELTALFGQLRPPALGTVFGALGRVTRPVLRAQLEQAAGALASQHTGELVKLIAAEDRAVALEAVHRAGALRAHAAVPPLARLLGDPDPSLRLAAVTALGEIGSPGGLQQLDRILDDADRDVRLAAVRALQARSYRPALPRLEAQVKGRVLRDRDLTEKQAVFEAYAAIAGDAAVPFLDGLLNGRGFLGRREDPELRACAALALGRLRGAAASDALARATADTKDDPIVRTAVSRALRAGVQ